MPSCQWETPEGVCEAVKWVVGLAILFSLMFAGLPSFASNCCWCCCCCRSSFQDTTLFMIAPISQTARNWLQNAPPNPPAVTPVQAVQSRSQCSPAFLKAHHCIAKSWLLSCSG
jgi:hypothetical protein